MTLSPKAASFFLSTPLISIMARTLVGTTTLITCGSTHAARSGRHDAVQLKSRGRAPRAACVATLRQTRGGRRPSRACQHGPDRTRQKRQHGARNHRPCSQRVSFQGQREAQLRDAQSHDPILGPLVIIRRRPGSSLSHGARPRRPVLGHGN